MFIVVNYAYSLFILIIRVQNSISFELFFNLYLVNIQGNMNTLVPPVQKLMKNAFNLNDIQAFRGNHSFNHLKINKISIIVLNFFFVFF